MGSDDGSVPSVSVFAIIYYQATSPDFKSFKIPVGIPACSSREQLVPCGLTTVDMTWLYLEF